MNGSVQDVLFQAPSIFRSYCLCFVTVILALCCTEETDIQNEQHGGSITHSNTVNIVAIYIGFNMILTVFSGWCFLCCVLFLSPLPILSSNWNSFSHPIGLGKNCQALVV